MQSAARLPAWRRRSAQHSMTHQQGMRLPGAWLMRHAEPCTCNSAWLLCKHEDDVKM